MAKQKREVVGTHQIHHLLHERFSAPEWALLHEVRNATGWNRRTRTADAIALNLWPSRGLELYGFEVKASRSDLKRELDDPDKAREIMQYCDRWYLVLGHKDLIQPGELPPTWGLMIAQKNRIVITTEAPKLESKPLDKGFIASILRNFTECYVPKHLLRDMVNAEYKKWQEGESKRNDIRVERAEREKRDLDDVVNQFEQASGINIRNRWKVGQIGRAVNLIMRGDFGQAEQRLEHLAINAAQIARQAEEELKVIRQLKEIKDDNSDRGN